ncbi:phage portal protein [Cryobacterium sp. Sr8]|uniref:phage portal protein n=1 Tax=Cryobacterium sp. Sr8 TaxID=1259203 RepID=UPI00106B4065|nr:phage portal protein [Cryobacterium sp. Sr8]TFD80706.1 phage portal protein [Cryobacterium sp. Sr8]
MSILFRKAAEVRAVSFQDVWGSGGSLASASKSALSLVPVYAATGLIADQFAAAPVAVFEKGSSGVPSRVDVQPDLVRDPGANGLDVYSWKHQAITSCLLRGNAYGLITAIDNQSRPSKVLWLNPEDVFVDEASGVPQYFYKGRLVPRADLIHIPAYVQAGSVVGLSPLGLFKAQIETGDQAQQFGKNWFKRGGIPSGVLKNSMTTISADQASTTKARFKASVAASEPFVTGKDWDYTPITVPGGEAQFISTLKLTATQFAAIYRVAPEDIGGETSGSSLTYKSLEQDQIRFAMRTLRPWTTRFEAVFDRYLFGTQYMRFNLDASARADLSTRMSAHAAAIGAGIETISEARALEERAPLTAEQWAEFMATRQAAPKTPAL